MPSGATAIGPPSSSPAHSNEVRPPQAAPPLSRSRGSALTLMAVSPLDPKIAGDSMPSEPLPENPQALEMLLGQATRFLDALDPILAKFRMQDRRFGEAVGDPETLDQSSPFVRKLQDAL